jgi:hypothetical protein
MKFAQFKFHTIKVVRMERQPLNVFRVKMVEKLDFLVTTSAWSLVMTIVFLIHGFNMLSSYQ